MPAKKTVQTKTRSIEEAIVHTIKQEGVRLSNKTVEKMRTKGIALVKVPKEQAPLQPYYNQVLILEEAKVTKTPGGLYIPESAQESKNEGIVIATGPGNWEFGQLIPCSAKVGDKVAYHKNAGHDITIAGKEYRIMRDNEIFGAL